MRGNCYHFHYLFFQLNAIVVVYERIVFKFPMITFLYDLDLLSHFLFFNPFVPRGSIRIHTQLTQPCVKANNECKRESGSYIKVLSHENKNWYIRCQALQNAKLIM